MPEKKIPRNFKYSFSETPSTLSDLFSTWIYYSDWPCCDFFSCTGLLGLNRSKLFPSLVANQLTTQKKAIGNLYKKDSSLQNKMEKKRTVFCGFVCITWSCCDQCELNSTSSTKPDCWEALLSSWLFWCYDLSCPVNDFFWPLKWGVSNSFTFYFKEQAALICRNGILICPLCKCISKWPRYYQEEPGSLLVIRALSSECSASAFMEKPKQV